MKNILVGINLLDQSPTVLKFALRLAQYHTSTLTVIHVLDYENPEVNNIYVPKDEEQSTVYEGFRRKKTDEVKAFINRHYTKQYHSIEIQIEVRFGYRHEELRLAAKEQKADLLVVGKLTNRPKLFFDDTTDKLISWSPCPVFIVPEDAEFESLQRIVYATDFILEDCESILYLLPWLEVFKAQLICLHICKNEIEESRAKRKLSILSKLFPQKNIFFRQVRYDVNKGIDRYIELSHTDLVAIIHQKRNLWDTFFKPSMSKAIAENVKIPMIIFQQEQPKI